jgi:Bacterial Ig-like domain (group 1)/Bacterial Ig-like domain (group 2)
MPAQLSRLFDGPIKIVATVASTGAAVVTVLSFLHSWGVFGNPDVPPPVANLSAHWIGVRPALDTADAIGDTLHFAATITDKNGSFLYGARPSWVSENAAIATVEPDGSVIARGDGTTTIIATVGEVSARAHVVVRQAVARVRVAGDSALSVAQGDTRAVDARAFDPHGYAIAARLPRWKTDNPAIVSFDSSGRLVANDVGRATITATIDGVAAQTIVNVAPSPAALVLVQGDRQRATAGATLRERVIVRVTDHRGRPVEGQMVRFAPSGAGVVDPAVLATDMDGRARTTWTLGDRPGRQTLLATVNRVDSALAIVADAAPSPENTKLVALSDTVAGVVRSVVQTAVRVTDSAGRPFADVPVAWTTENGSVVATADRTDSAGEAHASWTLGATAGLQRLRARVAAGVAMTTLLARARPASAARVSLARAASSDDPRVLNVVALVRDSFGNVVPRVPVRLTPRRGSVPSAGIESDSAGRALIAWTLAASSGDQMLIASVSGRAADTLVAHAPQSLLTSQKGAKTSARVRQSGRPR